MLYRSIRVTLHYINHSGNTILSPTKLIFVYRSTNIRFPFQFPIHILIETTISFNVEFLYKIQHFDHNMCQADVYVCITQPSNGINK